MNTENKELMKHLATTLRKRATSEKEQTRKIDSAILYYLTRRDIVTLVNEMYKGKVPGNPDLALLENEELLKLIPDDLFIISHILNGWCQELLKQPTVQISEDDEEGENDEN